MSVTVLTASTSPSNFLRSSSRSAIAQNQNGYCYHRPDHMLASSVTTITAITANVCFHLKQPQTTTPSDNNQKSVRVYGFLFPLIPVSSSLRATFSWPLASERTNANLVAFCRKEKHHRRHRDTVYYITRFLWPSWKKREKHDSARVLPQTTS